jgi:hypothetical protein
VNKSDRPRFFDLTSTNVSKFKKRDVDVSPFVQCATQILRKGVLLPKFSQTYGAIMGRNLKTITL